MAIDPARAKMLFLHASDLADPAERAAYLDRECGGDAELRGRVEALLAADGPPGPGPEPEPEPETIGVFQPTLAEALEATGMSAPETLAESRVPDPDSGLATVAATGAGGEDGTLAGVASVARIGGFVPGRVIGGRYTLLEVLGEGGMGTVYKAEQTEPVRRQVALKLIKVGMDSRTVLARFDAERQALAMMDHPNIARVYDGGVTEANQPFFVMEFVRGVPITDYCDRNRLPVGARLELFVAVCQAVQHAHQKGIIHRDLKPGNVMVSEVDGRPTPKVIDFGVAKATVFDLTDQSLGDTGAIVGTPAYMSPEQADPSSMDIDTRTDVYALGVILYELLAGSTPLDATQFHRGALLEMLRMVREVDPSRPSTKVGSAEALPSIAANRGIEPERLKRELRGDLDWIVMKALEKDRTRRYETANGFGADILRHLASEPVLAAPPSRSYRARKFVRKHRAGVLAASLVLLALVAGIAGTTLGLREARQQEVLANRRAEGERLAKQEALKAAEGEKTAKETAEDVLGFVETRVFAAARPKGMEGGLGYDVKLADAIAASVPAIEAGFAGKPLTEARLRRTIGTSFYYLGKPAMAAEQFEAAVALNRRHLGLDHPETLASTSDLASSDYARGRHAQALKLREETLARQKARLGPDHKDTLESMGNLAFSYDALGRHTEALELFEEATVRTRATLGPDHPNTLQNMNALANLYETFGRRGESIKLFEETLALRKAKLGPEHHETLRSMSDLATSYSAVGRTADAFKLDSEALVLRRATLGPDHSETLMSVARMAEAYLTAGRMAEALPLQEAYCAARPGNMPSSLRLAALQAWLGRGEGLAATRRRLLASAERADKMDALAADITGKVCSLLPSPDPSETEAAVALARRAVDLGKASDYLDYFLMDLGMAEYRAGHFAEADAASAAATARAGSPHRCVRETSGFYRAMSLFRQGRIDEARAVALAATAGMKPLPVADESTPAGETHHDDLIMWLAYKEAKALIGFDAPPAAPPKPDGK